MSTVKNQRFYFIPVGEENNSNYQSLLDQSLEYISGTTKFLGAVTAISTLNISSNSVMMGGVTALSSFNVSGTTSLMGKVGVGTNNPVAPLQVTANGATNISSGPALNGLYVFNPTNTANQDAVVCIRTGGSSAGNLLILIMKLVGQ
jgi:hypothetical protein